MAIELGHYVGTGLTPQAFIDGMTKNQDTFLQWYNTFAWPDDLLKRRFEEIGEKQGGLRCLILAADWCGDVVRNVPVVFQALNVAKVPVEVLILEQHLDLMDAHFLTMGGRSIPVVIFVSEQGDVLGKWGPRPAYVQEPMVAFKRDNPDRNAPDYEDNLKAARAELVRRYGEGPGYQADILRELAELLPSCIAAL